MTAPNLLVVSDTNIFIDLIDLDLFDAFLQLDFEVHTNIYVIEELRHEYQRQRVLSTTSLQIEHFETDNFIKEIQQLIGPRARQGLSFVDQTVLFQGIKLNATVLTGDKKMIHTAKDLEIDVHGILYIFDQLVAHKIIPTRVAHKKLSTLYHRNRRLPRKEIEQRLSDWGPTP